MSRLKSAVARLEARVRRDDPHAQCNCGWAVSKRKAAARPPGQCDPEEINAIRRALMRLQSEVPPPKPIAEVSDSTAGSCKTMRATLRW